jgi:bisphosphoglycerate-independent phosphoglycerate mutase (AlkP superfamily)
MCNGASNTSSDLSLEELCLFLNFRQDRLHTLSAFPLVSANFASFSSQDNPAYCTAKGRESNESRSL